jgi:phospholipid transport system substrate-binding protein
MKSLIKSLAVAMFSMVVGVLPVASSQAAPNEPPDVLLKRISTEVIDTVKDDKQIQNGNYKKVIDLVEAKILPHVNFQRMTSLAAGRHWREASPEQQKNLTAEFRDLLVYSYSGALSQVKNQKVNFKPLRADPADTEVEVRSEVVQARGEPVQLAYRMEKTDTGWKIYDINILGAWLVETYKGNFNAEITRGGIDGLIKSLSDRNKKLAEKNAAGFKPS